MSIKIINEYIGDGIEDTYSYSEIGDNIIGVKATLSGIRHHRVTADLSESPPCLPGARLLPVPSLTVGVGHEEDPITQMRGTKRCCRYTVPRRIIPAGGQVPENSSKEPTRVT